MDIRIHTVGNHSGFFSMLDTLLSTLAASERDGIPTYVDWSGATNYLDEPGNLFDEFFEQPYGLTKEDVASGRIVETVAGSVPYWERDHAGTSWYALDGERVRTAARLVEKYLVVKPGVLAEVETFAREKFSPRTLGVHLRGTDMRHPKYHRHQPTPLLSSYRKAFRREAARGGYTRVFCASDDQRMLGAFLESVRGAGLEAVTYASRRSGSHVPLHADAGEAGSKLALAKEALVECLLLSRCAYLIKSHSNVSNFSVFFRPSLPFFDLHSFAVERMRAFALTSFQTAYMRAGRFARALGVLKNA